MEIKQVEKKHRVNKKRVEKQYPTLSTYFAHYVHFDSLPVNLHFILHSNHMREQLFIFFLFNIVNDHLA